MATAPDVKLIIQLLVRGGPFCVYVFLQVNNIQFRMDGWVLA